MRQSSHALCSTKAITHDPRWLIVEDALKDRKGRWLEYVESFRRGLKSMNVEANVLVDRTAEDFVTQLENVHPILPRSIWDCTGDGAGRLQRYWRVPEHG